MKRPKFHIRLYRNYFFNIVPIFRHNRLRWKDKFNSPRCEREPSFDFKWIGFGIYGSWGDDDYWEQWLWVSKYYGGNYEEAKKNWPWTIYETGESSWKDY